jgi:hypothetical protein
MLTYYICNLDHKIMIKPYKTNWNKLQNSIPNNQIFNDDIGKKNQSKKKGKTKSVLRPRQSHKKYIEI